MKLKIELSKKEALEIIKREIEFRCLDAEFKDKLESTEVIIHD